MEATSRRQSGIGQRAMSLEKGTLLSAGEQDNGPRVLNQNDGSLQGRPGLKICKC